MYQPNFPQMPVHSNASTIQNSLPFVPVGQNDSGNAVKSETENGARTHAHAVVNSTKKFEDDLKRLGLRIKQHEENIRFLKNQKNSLDGSVLDMQVTLGKYHSSNGPITEREDLPDEQREEEAGGHILSNERSAEGILYQLKTRTSSQASNIPLIKDVLGVVATLGMVDDDNLSRLLTEYVGTKTMSAIVCKTFEGVKAMESYDKEGSINKISGFHGLGASIGKTIDGRFLVICLEKLRPCVAEFLSDDPQRRLDLLKPRLPGGKLPHGFIGYAVNMIHIENSYLIGVTASGHGLRETLFYHVFSHLQVYKTREDLLQALPFITDGALSLDGGMIRSSGVFSLGNGEKVSVKFPKRSEKSCLPEEYHEVERRIKDKKWESEEMLENIRREQALLDEAKFTFEMKKQEFVQFLAQSSQSGPIQHQTPVGQEKFMPR